MENFVSTSAGLAAARFSNLAKTENTDKTAAARMDAGIVGVARRRAVRKIRTINLGNRRRRPPSAASAPRKLEHNHA